MYLMACCYFIVVFDVIFPCVPGNLMCVLESDRLAKAKQPNPGNLANKWFCMPSSVAEEGRVDKAVTSHLETFASPLQLDMLVSLYPKLVLSLRLRKQSI
jgi:hypothetical protein